MTITSSIGSKWQLLLCWDTKSHLVSHLLTGPYVKATRYISCIAEYLQSQDVDCMGFSLFEVFPAPSLEDLSCAAHRQYAEGLAGFYPYERRFLGLFCFGSPCLVAKTCFSTRSNSVISVNGWHELFKLQV
jgi:hypothetical protein